MKKIVMGTVLIATMSIPTFATQFITIGTGRAICCESFFGY